MSKKWAIEKWNENDFLLVSVEGKPDKFPVREGIYLHFDQIMNGVHFYRLYRNGRLGAELSVSDNEVVNYDDFAEKYGGY